MARKRIVVSGMRPTGPLHIGHLFGSLKNWVSLQEDSQNECYFLIADYQVLDDHLPDVRKGKIPENVKKMVADWIAAGLDPQKSYFLLQSMIPQLSELSFYFSYLVTVARLRRNPTLKDKAKNVGIDSEKDRIPLGFLGYPVSQAADILLFKGELVPVGEDQLPHLEQTREIARRFNRLFRKIFPEPRPILSSFPRILGFDGRKMSKSFNNGIFFDDSPEEIKKKIKKAKTDSGREIVYNPEKKPMISNLIRIYSAVSEKTIKEIEKEFEGSGYEEFKEKLSGVIIERLKKIREKREKILKDEEFIKKTLMRGIEKGREVGEKTMKEVREAVFQYSRIGL